ncbi:hypothetical protein BDZ90DRAFT_2075 [Jaminaea rosea]|uniref:AA1-like domain-containing protein n=1 Tax=Jaminaea rosea TaxID=1569628 RepID=A0A316UYV8_9BASI|nr:hypothetical protein BDZ90DRAFT_2075 [Jaminaea rosea]PWN29978.1 hypothetical protein BDZ90DRAFT_2075 [Jaminaea rosea]
MLLLQLLSPLCFATLVLFLVGDPATAASISTVAERADCSTAYHIITLDGNFKYWKFTSLNSTAGQNYHNKICSGGAEGYLHSKPKVEGNFIGRLFMHCSTGKEGYIDFGFRARGLSIAKPSGAVYGHFSGNPSTFNVGYYAICNYTA